MLDDVLAKRLTGVQLAFAQSSISSAMCSISRRFGAGPAATQQLGLFLRPGVEIFVVQRAVRSDHAGNPSTAKSGDKTGTALHYQSDRKEPALMAIVASISQQIWDMKYRLKAPSGEPVDKTIEDTWRRIAAACAAPERDPAPNGTSWAERFHAAMEDFRFLP